jgi:methyl-accepting chemotaxis protein
LAEEGSRQASSLKTLASSARQQATASAQIATSTEEVRTRLSEVVRGSAEQSGSAKSAAEELRGASAQLARLRRMQTEQAQVLTGLLVQAPPGDGAPGAA